MKGSGRQKRRMKVRNELFPYWIMQELPWEYHRRNEQPNAGEFQIPVTRDIFNSTKDYRSTGSQEPWQLQDECDPKEELEHKNRWYIIDYDSINATPWWSRGMLCKFHQQIESMNTDDLSRRRDYSLQIHRCNEHRSKQRRIHQIWMDHTKCRKKKAS